MSGPHTPGPWFVFDQRASTLRAQGWEGPAQDAILISCYPPSEVSQEHCDCIVARIEFSNRPEELTESNYADARLIAAAPELLEVLQSARQTLWHALDHLGVASPDDDRTIAEMDAAIAKARGEAA